MPEIPNTDIKNKRKKQFDFKIKYQQKYLRSKK